MDGAHQKLLKKQRVTLAQQLDSEEVLQYLICENIINDRIVEIVQSKDSKFRQNVELLSRLPNRGPRAFGVFVEALQGTDQGHLANLLLQNIDQQSNSPFQATIQSENPSQNNEPSLFSFSPPDRKRQSSSNNENPDVASCSYNSADFQPKSKRQCCQDEALVVVPSPCNELSDLESITSMDVLISESSTTVPKAIPNIDLSLSSGNIRLSSQDLSDGPGRDDMIVRRAMPQFMQRHEIGSYTMDKNPRGCALIISIDRFQPSYLQTRLGGEIDRSRLECIFRQLGFRCYVLVDGTGAEIWDTLQKFAALKEHETADCMMLCVMTHGHEGIFYGSDGVAVSIDETLKLFSNENCSALQNKPKVFFFQSCRGDDPDRGVDEVDSPSKVKTSRIQCPQDDLNINQRTGPRTNLPRPPRANKLPDSSDCLIGYATVSGYTAMRNTSHGSWFIQALVRVLAYHANDKHLLEIMTIVNSIIKAREGHCPDSAFHRCKEMSEFRSTLCKKLYFFPGL